MENPKHADTEPRGLLHHVEINVSDLRASAEFWGWLLQFLGYHEHQQWDRGISWKRGVTYLVLVQVGEKHARRRYHRSAVGLNHIAFHLPERAHFQQLLAELEARGISLLYADRHPNAGGGRHLAAFFEDPDRIKVEIVGPSSEDSAAT